MLISKRVKLGLLQDIDMQLFFERGIRGGINGVGELRHFTAINFSSGQFRSESKNNIRRFSRSNITLRRQHAKNDAFR